MKHAIDEYYQQIKACNSSLEPYTLEGPRKFILFGPKMKMVVLPPLRYIPPNPKSWNEDHHSN